MASGVPVIEIADHTDPISIRSPHRKAHPAAALVLNLVGTEKILGMPVTPLAKEVQIEIGERRGLLIAGARGNSAG
ncbi:hypothetical protein HH1059_03080 [Halorhodospira halochloris]|uniref:Uncharacterized protein n=1 Tax=Halorhodospira halochloris TaxID=1052 RepID=A0A2Z6EZA0_HALHR|nr:hypothetical protein HH1059_03080 [Halorhodospira halochloris]